MEVTSMCVIVMYPHMHANNTIICSSQYFSTISCTNKAYDCFELKTALCYTVYTLFCVSEMWVSRKRWGLVRCTHKHITTIWFLYVCGCIPDSHLFRMKCEHFHFGCNVFCVRIPVANGPERKCCKNSIPPTLCFLSVEGLRSLLLSQCHPTAIFIKVY